MLHKVNEMNFGGTKKWGGTVDGRNPANHLAYSNRVKNGTTTNLNWWTQDFLHQQDVFKLEKSPKKLKAL